MSRTSTFFGVCHPGAYGVPRYPFGRVSRVEVRYLVRVRNQVMMVQNSLYTYQLTQYPQNTAYPLARRLPTAVYIQLLWYQRRLPRPLYDAEFFADDASRQALYNVSSFSLRGTTTSTRWEAAYLRGAACPHRDARYRAGGS